MLSEKLSKAASLNLIHVNLGDCQIGGQGVRLILQSMLEGGGAGSLLRLDLQSNNVSLASESFSFVGQFANLR